jgi:hypothetical protein
MKNPLRDRGKDIVGYWVQRLPVDQRKMISGWIDDEKAKRQIAAKLDRAMKKNPGLQPTQSQAALLLKLMGGGIRLADADEGTMESCIANGWARRQSTRLLIRPAGRAWIIGLRARSNKNSVISRVVSNRRNPDGPQSNTAAPAVARVRNRDAQPCRSETKSQESTDAF